MMKKIFFCLFILVSNIALSQQFVPSKLFIQRIDSLKENADKILDAKLASLRLQADSIFTRQLIRCLKEKNAFQYPFDELLSISKIIAPDSTFKIFTWNLPISENMVRQHGAIQFKTTDGSLKLLPLIDRSENTLKIADTIGDNFGWMGALYYNIVKKEFKGETFYSLFGFDDFRFKSNRKFIEILQIKNGKPIFGAPIFDFSKASQKVPTQNRFIIEYKKEATPKLNYDSELDLIIAEHLISETNEPNKRSSFVGDGDYQGFKWENGKWQFIEKIYNQITNPANLPIAKPIVENKFDIPKTNKPKAKKN